MTRSSSATLFLAAILVCLPARNVAFAQTEEPAYFSVPGIDAPQLAPRGKYSVGVRTLDIVHPGQPDILHLDRKTGKAPLYDRPLTLEIWYPATIPAGQTERTMYHSPMVGRVADTSEPHSFDFAGKALRDAPPVTDGPFPLVVVSHGFPGSRTFLSYLSENLASKGYVVAAIDHTDSLFGNSGGFPSTLLNRAADQLFTIEDLTRRAARSGNFLHGLLDGSRAAIVGYSMGGYGALVSAGAGLSKAGLAARLVPGGYLDSWMAGNAQFNALPRGALKAIVAIAPWGGQSPFGSFDPAGMAAIHIPSLFIVGDQDDVAGYENGVKKLFEASVGSNRCMLVYENARHNVGANPPPPGVPLDFQRRESFDEPVWRKDRIIAINEHFITAFLNLYLKGDESARSFLYVSPEKSNEGMWPVGPGETGEGFAKDGQKYWKGFQRRWALGLEMHCATSGTPAPAPAK